MKFENNDPQSLPMDTDLMKYPFSIYGKYESNSTEYCGWEKVAEISMKSRKVICMLGSTKFRRSILEWAWAHTKLGELILFAPFAKEEMDEVEQCRYELEAQHFQKIRMADEVFVYNLGGYVGDSTRRKILYAQSLHKPIRYLELPQPEAAPR